MSERAYVENWQEMGFRYASPVTAQQAASQEKKVINVVPKYKCCGHELGDPSHKCSADLDLVCKDGDTAIQPYFRVKPSGEQHIKNCSNYKPATEKKATQSSQDLGKMNLSEILQKMLDKPFDIDKEMNEDKEEGKSRHKEPNEETEKEEDGDSAGQEITEFHAPSSLLGAYGLVVNSGGEGLMGDNRDIRDAVFYQETYRYLRSGQHPFEGHAIAVVKKCHDPEIKSIAKDVVRKNIWAFEDPYPEDKKNAKVIFVLNFESQKIKDYFFHEYSCLDESGKGLSDEDKKKTRNPKNLEYFLMLGDWHEMKERPGRHKIVVCDFKNPKQVVVLPEKDYGQEGF